MPNYISRTQTDGGTGALGGAPYGATKRCNGWVKMPNWASGEHADGGTGAFGRDPRCAGCAGRMRTVALGPS
eukprot:2069566-Pyramimonas_sp.AAC.1